jgi:hypothetical protein
MFIWTIENLIVSSQLNGRQNVVLAASWRVRVTKDGIQGSAHGQINFPAPNGDKFTAYENLTEEEILSWVWEIGKSDDPDRAWSKEIAEQHALAILNEQRKTTAPPLPWISPTPPQPERPTLEQRTEALELLVDYLLEGPTA